ncbi:peroxidase-like [Neocloeon triangulifer]|uniref:peroxidase-like n=1 Tax=Neocloeon triangulifer TaxID=2078957 RepID=UPI00286F4FEA|nr:peroxidase-like [Neocloeon triangulifer]
MKYGGAVLVAALCAAFWTSGSTFRMPAAEHLANYASWPFWVFGRPHRLGRQHQTAAELPKVDPEVLHTSVKFGENVIGRLARLEKTLANADVRVRPGSAPHGQLIAGNPVDGALERHRQAQVAVRASQFIADNNCKRFDLKERRCGELVNSLSLDGTDLSAHCDTAVDLECNTTSPFRSIDGSCNNRRHPVWGRSMTAYQRMLRSQYGDGLHQMKKSQSAAAPLPGAREVSATLAADKERPDREATMAVMQWAQFVGLDLAHTPSAKMVFTGSSIACCKPDGGLLPPRSLHPFCAPIPVPADDPVFKGRRCLDYVRSVTAPRPDCKFGPAEQMNQATHWLDLSMVYGTTDDISRGLRAHENGLLQTSDGSLLALSPEPTTDCQLTTKPLGACFKSGDSRVNEQPMLTALHTAWVREHNRVANTLYALNPHWNDERLFQEARRIVVAEYQHITFDHWAPVLLGELYSRQMGLHKADYSENVDPAVRNSFATAALHFLYSMMPGNIQLTESDRRVNSTLRLREHFNKPGVLQKPGRLDQLLRTMATQNAQKVDLIHTEEVTSGLFAGNLGLGADALSLVVQRGRDHGLPGYNDFRAACGLPRMSCIDELADLIPKAVVNQLKTLYASVNDVDLFVGAMAERPADGALVGPTFRCLIGRQLSDTRRADRYFFDLQDQAGSFTPEQLTNIRKTSLARVFCSNGDQIKFMQRNVFLAPRTKGSLAGDTQDASVARCSDLPDLDLSPWREQSV